MGYPRIFIVVGSVFLLSPLPLLAQVYMTQVMPNTVDDANMEYIDIVNTGCEVLDIGGYTIADKVKAYVFAAGSTLDVGNTYRLERLVSKLELNNTNEELILTDASGVEVQRYSYASSVKGVAIDIPGVTYDTCDLTDMGGEEDIGTDEDSTGDSGTGVIDEALPTEEDVGIIDEGSPETGTGEITEDTSTDEEATGSGVENIGEGEPETGTGETLPTDIEEIADTIGDTPSDSTDDSEEEVTTDIGETDIIQTTNLLGKSGSLEPQILLYDDSDGDGYIDTMEVLYDVYITGSVDINKIYLYSNTGGLYESRVNTQTGYILDAEIEDNILRLFIEPSHIAKNTLIHNATTSSDIRLKSSGGFGVTSLSGELVGDFLLTSSFDVYREVYSKSVYESLGQEDAAGEVVTDPGSIAEVGFPEIIPTIQNYTNTLYSGDSFTCRENPCRLNLNFEDIFNNTYLSRDYSCSISYNGVTEDKCNPSQWTPTGAGGFDVRIIHKATSQSVSQYFPIEWNIVPVTSTTNTYVPTNDRYAPITSIRLNGTLTKRQIQISDNELYCYTSTCAVNFDGTGTYDPDGASMTYSWTDNGVVFATRKNPSVREFSLGEHTVVFSVTDASGKTTTEEYKITVFGEMDIPDEVQAEFASTSIPKSKTTSTKKSKPILLFSPPELVVEKSSVPLRLKNGGYQCVTTAATCSINFALSGTLSGLQYKIWYDSDMDPTWTSNPRSRAFKSGKHTLTLTAHYTREGGAIWQQTIPIEVVRYKKVAVVKKKTIQTPTKATSSPKMEIIPTTYAADDTMSTTSGDNIIYLLFLSILLNVFFLRRKFTKTV